MSKPTLHSKSTLLLLLLFATCTAMWGQPPKVVAHRGFWRAEGSAQNSVSSLIEAAKLGCYGVEFDVWYTADNELVVYHDKKFNNQRVEKIDSKQMVGTPLENGEPLPSLDDMLAEACNYPDIVLVLEYKTSRNSKARKWEGAEAIVRKVEQYNLQDRTTYISFSPDAARAFVSLSPSSKVYFLRGDFSAQRIKKEGFAGADYPQILLFTLNRGFTSRAHDLGLEVGAWTLNSERALVEAAELGVDFVTTNYPEVALELYK